MPRVEEGKISAPAGPVACYKNNSQTHRAHHTDNTLSQKARVDVIGSLTTALKHRRKHKLRVRTDNWPFMRQSEPIHPEASPFAVWWVLNTSSLCTQATISQISSHNDRLLTPSPSEWRFGKIFPLLTFIYCLVVDFKVIYSGFPDGPSPSRHQTDPDQFIYRKVAASCILKPSDLTVCLSYLFSFACVLGDEVNSDTAHIPVHLEKEGIQDALAFDSLRSVCEAQGSWSFCSWIFQNMTTALIWTAERSRKLVALLAAPATNLLQYLTLPSSHSMDLSVEKIMAIAHPKETSHSATLPFAPPQWEWGVCSSWETGGSSESQKGDDSPVANGAIERKKVGYQVETNILLFTTTIFWETLPD